MFDVRQRHNHDARDGQGEDCIVMKQLFGADGIRGRIDQYPFRMEDQIRLGQSLAKWWLVRVSDPVLLVGADTRESNQRIKAALVDGLTKAGIEIWDVGILPTAALSFLIAQNPELAGGIMISASHNPIFENGIKVFDERGMKINDLEEAKIEEAFFAPEERLLSQNKSARVRSAKALIEQYTQALISEFQGIQWHTHKILVDCANGASYWTAQAVLNRLGIHHAIHNILPDGTNINFGVGSEFVRKYPREFANELHKSGAELGVAFDGDADRVVFVDRNGILYDGDMLLSIAAYFMNDRDLLKNKRVVTTLMSNSGLAAHLRQIGVQTEVVRNGDKYITDVLVDNDLSLGGEQIGHLIFRTHPLTVTGDGLRTFLWILQAFSETKDIALHELMRGLRKWPQINVSVTLGGRMLSQSEEIPGLVESKQKLCDAIKDLSRFECRPASTEPVYRIMLEAEETPVSILAQQALELAHHIQKHFGRQGEPVEILDCITGGKVEPTSYLP
jgi:phosphoglucosamine mutase